MKDENILGMYLNEINNIPLLTREEENDLATRAKGGDAAAREKIVSANLRFVVNVAKQYKGKGLDFEDLISEGNVGLLTAIDKFDVTKGYHFISYAVWWIRQSILKAVQEKSAAIRLPQNRVADLSRIRAAKKVIHGKTEEQKILAVAKSLGMQSDIVRDLLNISREMISLDKNVHTVGNKKSTVGELIEDTRYQSPEDYSVEKAIQGDISNALETLRPNEANVLRMRYGLEGNKPMSLQEIGDKCSLTKERIRQIEKRAIERMRTPVCSTRLYGYMAA